MTAEYFAHPALSRSDLLGILNNVEMWRAQKDGVIPRPGPTPSMVFGSALDFYLAGGKGPDPLPENAVVIPSDLLAKNGAKSTSAAKKFIAAHPDKQCLTPQEAERLRGEADAQLEALAACEAQIMAHAMARRLLLDGDPVRQAALYWDDLETGQELKSLPDAVQPGTAIVDLKTADDTSHRAFLAAARRYGYDMQAAMGIDGWMACHEEHLPFVFVVVRNVAPHDVVVYGATSKFVECGRMRVAKAIRKFADCELSGVWREPDHGSMRMIKTPAWWMKEETEQEAVA